MTNEFLLTLLVAAPLLGAITLPFLGRFSENLRNIAALLFVVIACLCSLALIPVVMSGTIVSVSIAGFPIFLADNLAVFMALVSSLVGSIIVFYSFGYIEHYEFRDEYYFMVVLFLGAMMGLVFSRNLIMLYLFWEITAIACWRLIGFFREKSYVWKADKAFLVTVFGALMMLVGFLFIYDQTHSFDLVKIKQVLNGQPISNIAVSLILCGILSKSATVPLHTWLPDAGVAPSPVTALLHAAVLVKIGVYVYARLFVATFAIDPMWHTIVPIIAGASALISAGAALIDTDIKRIIAYSTVSQLAFIILGLSIGNKIGLLGAILYILMHGLAKGGLFLCAGIVEHQTHTKDITKLGGLFKTMPITAISFILCAFSVMGIPPLGGFFSKFMVMTGAVASGSLLIPIVFLVGGFMTIIYLFRVFVMVFLGESKLAGSFKEGSNSMIISVAILALLSIAGGVLINVPSDFALAAVQQMLEVVK